MTSLLRLKVWGPENSGRRGLSGCRHFISPVSVSQEGRDAPVCDVRKNCPYDTAAFTESGEDTDDLVWVQVDSLWLVHLLCPMVGLPCSQTVVVIYSLNVKKGSGVTDLGDSYLVREHTTSSCVWCTRSKEPRGI